MPTKSVFVAVTAVAVLVAVMVAAAAVPMLRLPGVPVVLLLSGARLA